MRWKATILDQIVLVRENMSSRRLRSAIFARKEGEKNEAELEKFITKEDVVAGLDWEALRWRNLDWELIPPDMRERVVTFLDVPDNISLNNAMTSHKNKEELRVQLINSYIEAKIPAFDTYCFTEKNNFQGLRWMMRAGVGIQSLKLMLTDVKGERRVRITRPSHVLRRLVERGLPGIASLYAQKSKSKDIIRESPLNVEWGDECTTLYIAAYRGYTTVVKILLDRGADPNRVIEGGLTPLYVAAEYGHVETVKVLMDGGADANKLTSEEFFPLYVASERGNLQTVKALLERPTTNAKLAHSKGFSALYAASKEGHAEIARILIATGVLDLNAIVCRCCGATCLTLASNNGCGGVVRELIKGGADINRADYQGLTPLHIASQHGHGETASILIKAGADVNAVEQAHTRTALHFASQHGHGETASILIKGGADVNAVEQAHTRTALHLAVAEGHIEVLRTLIGEGGADVNKACAEGRTPLHVAVIFGRKSAAVALLEAGADSSVVDRESLTPFQIAKSEDNPEIECLLRHR